jgi:multidrug transporter EmrE-like cation transporter
MELTKIIMMHWLLLIIAIVFTAIANISLKHATSYQPDESGSFTIKLLQQLANPPLIFGISCLVIALGAYSVALRKIPLIVGYPVMTTSVIVLVTAASAVWFGETYTILKLAGTALVIAGVVLLSA